MMPYTYPNQLTIEKTPHYFIKKPPPELIFKMNPDIKLILIIRDPVKRAESHYTHYLESRQVFVDSNNSSQLFEKTILVENGTVRDPPRSSWIKHGRYIKYLKRWLVYFKMEQIQIVDGESFIKNPFNEIKKVEKFLNLRPYIKQEHFVYDPKKRFYCMNKKLDNKTVECLASNKGRKHANLSESVINKLHDFYRPYSDELFQLLQQPPYWKI